MNKLFRNKSTYESKSGRTTPVGMGHKKVLLPPGSNKGGSGVPPGGASNNSSMIAAADRNKRVADSETHSIADIDSINLGRCASEVSWLGSADTNQNLGRLEDDIYNPSNSINWNKQYDQLNSSMSHPTKSDNHPHHPIYVDI